MSALLISSSIIELWYARRRFGLNFGVTGKRVCGCLLRPRIENILAEAECRFGWSASPVKTASERRWCLMASNQSLPRRENHRIGRRVLSWNKLRDVERCRTMSFYQDLHPLHCRNNRRAYCPVWARVVTAVACFGRTGLHYCLPRANRPVVSL